MREFEVVIVGAGPRGLSLLERLWAFHRATQPGWGLHVTMLDPAEPGQGAHSASQPAHFYANTVAGQITLFTDSSLRDAGPIVEGPSLLEWARAAGYRQVADAFIKTDRDGTELQENDYLPRALLGGYLTHVFDQLARDPPLHCRLSHVRRAAIDLAMEEDGKVAIVLEGGYRFRADCIVLTTGHAANLPSQEEELFAELARTHRRRNPRLAFFAGVNPIDQLRSIDAGAEVCIQGIGLTAYDIISHLSVGRGGRYRRDDQGALIYEPSGREPRMTITSRQGIPFSARAVNEKGLSGLHRPRFFTRARIDELRQRRRAETGDPRLDFERDLWPILLKEMCCAYDLSAGGSGAAQNAPASEEAEAAVAKLLQPLAKSVFRDHEDFTILLRRHLEEDLREAARGNVTSPIKAAADVLRDTRDYIRYAVDHRGLTEASHRRFNEVIVPLMYRISAGAPKERNAELCALADIGLVRFGPGPRPTLRFSTDEARFILASTALEEATEQSFDVVIRARIDSCIEPERQTSGLFTSMLKRGFACVHRNGTFKPGGIDVDDKQKVIAADGRAHPNVWALGIIVEGANFCTYVLPRVFVNSRFLQFSGRCAAGIFDHLESRAAPRAEADVVDAIPESLAS